jgi:Fic family protein
MPDAVLLSARLHGIAALPGVMESADAAREACTRLRFNETLRRRVPEAAAESRIRGARASAALEGAEVPLDRVRDHVRGALPWPEQPDPVEQVLRGVVQATAETEHAQRTVLTTPLQALARLHVAAMAGLLPAEQVGRPRQGEERSHELTDLGPAPPPAVVSGRLADLAVILTTARDVPAVVVAGLAHAEIASVRPFVRGNGAVARAMERAIIQASGLDPTGVCVPEVGHAAEGGSAYLGALTAYGSGSRAGVGLWLSHCGDAVVSGATEGEAICAAVRAGRLG